MFRFLFACLAGATIAAAAPSPAHAAPKLPPIPEHAGDFYSADFPISDGSTLPLLHIHYVTLGAPRRSAAGRVTNAVLLLHGTTGTGASFLTADMRRQLFAPGQPLDAHKYFIVIPDGLGRGGSSKPSDGMRTLFPHYGYGDVINADHLMLTRGLGVNHLRLVLGTSMGGMQTWMWGERYPDMTDALMPISSQPVAQSGRNWLWRQTIIGAIESDPGWLGGYYLVEPRQWTRVMPLFAIMTGNPARQQAAAPTRDDATRLYNSEVADAAHNDANDVLYWFQSSWDYNPEPQLGHIRAHVFAVNFDDDLINATDLGIMQREVPKIPHGRYVEVPEDRDSYGHQTLAHPEVWKKYLVQLLAEQPR